MERDLSWVFKLRPAEKLRMIEALWDDLASNTGAARLPSWQHDELDRRKASLMDNPASALSWDDVQRRIRSRHGR